MIEYQSTAVAYSYTVQKMSIEASSNNQMQVNRKRHVNIEPFQIEESEDCNHIVTSDGQHISNIHKEEQVCIHD
jgi:hypothetical protein